MRYSIAADSGGSKLCAVLFDQNFHIVRKVTTGGTNTNVRPLQEVWDNVAACVRGLLEDSGVGQVDLLCGYFTPAEKFVEEIEKYAVLRRTSLIPEGALPVFSRGVFKEAVGVISGTGSDVFYIKDQVLLDTFGGWGYLIGDDGSGYDIGREVLRCALSSEERQGRPNLLGRLLCERYGCASPRGCIGDIYGAAATAAEIASLTRLAAKAARLGDPEAVDIFRRAGVRLARETCAMIKKHRLAFGTPVCLGGGSFKASPHMLQSFCSHVEAQCPGIPVLEPDFEPVAGGVLWAYKEAAGSFTPEDYSWFQENLTELKIRKGETVLC